MPITWRNIEAPNFGQAGQLLNVSNNLITQGADQLTNIMQARAAVQGQEWDAQKNQNTQNAINNIRGLTTDQLKQATVAGLVSPYGAQIDAQQVRDAFNNQDEFIAGNLQTAQNIKDSNDRTQYGGTYDTFMQALAQGDMKTAQGLAAQLKGTVFGVDAANAFRATENTRFEQNATNRRLAMEGQANALAAKRLQMEQVDHDLRQQQLTEARSWAQKGQQTYADAIRQGKDPEAAMQEALLSVPAQYVEYFKRGGQGVAGVTKLTTREQQDLNDSLITPLTDYKTSLHNELVTKKDNVLTNSGLNQDEIKAYEQQGVNLNSIIGDGGDKIPKNIYDELINIAANDRRAITTNELAAVKLRYNNGDGALNFQDSADDLYKKIKQMRTEYDYYKSQTNTLNSEYNSQINSLDRQLGKYTQDIQRSKLMNVDPKYLADKRGEVEAQLLQSGKSLKLSDVPVYSAQETPENAKTSDSLTAAVNANAQKYQAMQDRVDPLGLTGKPTSQSQLSFEVENARQNLVASQRALAAASIEVARGTRSKTSLDKLTKDYENKQQLYFKLAGTTK